MMLHSLPIVQFLAVHCCVFVVFVLLFSFSLFCRQEIDRVNDRDFVVPYIESERHEKIDDHVSAVHPLDRNLILKRKRLLAGLDSIDDAAEKAKLYGVQRTSPKRRRALGYQAKILRYTRKDVVYVPEISHDSKRCDLWSDYHDISYLTKCSLSEGEEACFKCIESRRFIRRCVHVNSPLRVSLNPQGNSDFVTIPANEHEDEGYCLSRVFANIIDNGTENGQPGTDVANNCNPHTGTWLLVRQSALGDSTYNWICQCRYPNLMTNLTTIFSDCMKPVGCQPHGRLDDDTSAGKVNPYVSGRCVCEKSYESGYDKTVGPICVPRVVFSEDNLPQNVYRDHNLNMYSRLHWPSDRDLLDNRLGTISGNNPEGLYLPNPCHYDAVTYKRLPVTLQCSLVSEKIGKERVAYCVQQHPNAVVLRTPRDYLLNNNGKYGNACMLVNTESGQTQTENYILSYQTSRSIENCRPDFGCMYERASQLNKVFDYLREHDDEYRRFAEKVSPPLPVDNPVGDEQVIIALGNIDRWITVYEQTPIQSTQLYGLKGDLMRSYTDKYNLEGVVYNLRDRKYFWYCIRNPLGDDHWYHGQRSGIKEAIRDWIGWIANPTMMDDFVPRTKGAWIYNRGEERLRGFNVSSDDFRHWTVSNRPKFVPPWRIVMPFASGSQIDDNIFSTRYYPALFPIYRVPKKQPPPDNVMKMPFVFNTSSDLMDSTLTVHKYAPSVWLMSEQLCGDYRNHRKTMKFKLQGTYV